MGKIERMDNKISFIGVGPGDPELLTLKALKKNKNCRCHYLDWFSNSWKDFKFC